MSTLYEHVCGGGSYTTYVDAHEAAPMMEAAPTYINAEPRRLKLQATKEGRLAQQFIILSALFRGVAEFRDAASWLAPDDQQELLDRQYRGRNFRKYSVRSFMTTISSIS